MLFLAKEYHHYIDGSNVVEYWEDGDGTWQMTIEPYDGKDSMPHFPCGICRNPNWRDCYGTCSWYLYKHK